MTEEDAIFDPNMKKKKKKKKTPFDLEAALEGGDEKAEVAEETTPTIGAPQTSEPQENEEKKTEDVATDLDDFSIKKKKKKKIKTQPFDMEALEDTLVEAESATKGLSQHTPVESAQTEAIDFDADLDFTRTKKKRKKPKSKPLDSEVLENGDPSGKVDDSELKDMSGTTWAGTDRDYLYEELLTRVFDIMRAKNPDMVTGEKKRFIMRPPQVVRVGTKKTSFVNFTDLCKMLHRPIEHLLAFLLAEMGTSGSIDGNSQLIIKGRFQQKQVENVLRRYIKEYVTCHTCRSSDTFLHKENRLFFLQCERCQSRCSVASIKSGYQAVTAKRAQIRAKAN